MPSLLFPPWDHLEVQGRAGLDDPHHPQAALSAVVYGCLGALSRCSSSASSEAGPNAAKIWDQARQPRISQSARLTVVWDSLHSSGASQSVEQLVCSSRCQNMELVCCQKWVKWVQWCSSNGIQPCAPYCYLNSRSDWLFIKPLISTVSASEGGQIVLTVPFWQTLF